MGNIYSNTYHEDKLPEWIPESRSEPTFDPHFGFQYMRKKREMKITKEEMDAARLKPEQRNYCAYLLPQFLLCAREKSPFYILCHKEKENYLHCLREDYLIRMKEFEREKRLRIRQRKLEGKNVE